MPVHTEISSQGKQNPTLFCCTFSGDKENNIMSYDDKKEQSGEQKLTLLATGPLLWSSSPDVCPATRMFSFWSIFRSLSLIPWTSSDATYVDTFWLGSHEQDRLMTDESCVSPRQRSRPVRSVSNEFLSVMLTIVLTLWYINKEDELEMFQVWNVECKT